MVAVIGLGRSVDGALLSSEDVRSANGFGLRSSRNRDSLLTDQQERAGE
jgi:hypothetical protein